MHPCQSAVTQPNMRWCVHGQKAHVILGGEHPQFFSGAVSEGDISIFMGEHIINMVQTASPP